MLRTYTALLEKLKTEYAERIAFRYYEEASDTVKEITYGQYVRDIHAYVCWLEKQFGILRGKHIALLAKNSYAYVVALYAVMAAGGIAVPLNTEKSLEEIRYETELADISVILHDGVFLEREPELESAFRGALCDIAAFSGDEDWPLPEDLDAEALTMILFTSGTTGHSKGVMLSAKAIFVEAISDIGLSDRAQMGIGEAPDAHISEFLVLPMYHVAALNRWMVRMLGGNTIHFCSNLRYFYRDLEKMPSDYMLMVPMIMKSIHKDIVNGRASRLCGLKTLVCGGAMLDAEQMKDLTHNGYFVMNCYGMTELFTGGTRNTSQEIEKLHSIGTGDPIYEYRIIDGELCLRGEAVMMGYYKNPKETAETIDAEGWLHTGDLARVDADGYYYITGRKKNLIILASGENVSPEELEDLVQQDPNVSEVVVKEAGNRICAEVYCTPEKQEEIRAFIVEINRTLPYYKQMTTVKFRTEPFERTATGKIKRL